VEADAPTAEAGVPPPPARGLGPVRREAMVKCTGSGLGSPPPQEPIWVSDLDPGPGWIAAIALRGEGELRQRRFELEPAG
jgi:hypothetical protein